ncbi:hypothetical protein GL50803_0015343 [Giardia duodenalis]|uniref:Uncharacterized protein n=1 Tax=Giardia intestinalis (strain ATCC 50803 / WB clone C6) TaxID=184922 RepID=A8B5Z0_GIAIC|nr:hypothetical protein GL50803_0015343 [Giardia intestinalis]KAE8305078.1 hypothetical protein GL50803_0015343 [Giardia intestinalis]|eukprot:XP_001709338.1 Hypothetical protein GL50803_15343 [Giardia lamblia ATCC 50803]
MSLPNIVTTMFQPTGSVNITAAAILPGEQPADDGIVFAHKSNLYYYTASNNQPQCLASMPGHTSTIIAILTYRQSPSNPHSILSVSQSGELILWSLTTSSRSPAAVQYTPSLVDVGRLTTRPITCIDAHDNNTILLGCTSCIVICRRFSVNTHFEPTNIEFCHDQTGQLKLQTDLADNRSMHGNIITALHLKPLLLPDTPSSSQLALSAASDSLVYCFYISMVNVVYYVEVALKNGQDTSSSQGRDYRPQEPQQQNAQQAPVPMSHRIIWRNDHQPVIDSIYSTTIGSTEYIFFGRRNGNLTILSFDKNAQQYSPLYDGPLTPSLLTDLGTNHMLQNRSSIRLIQAFAKFNTLCIVSMDSTVLFLNLKKLGECSKKISNLSLLTQSVVRHVGRYITASFEQLHSEAEGPVLRLFAMAPTTDTSVVLC